jgi:peptidoglycan/LPS O-acetylase OafA/YrhL
MGVPIFFVVSGYCISASIDSLRRRSHSLAQYFWRRLRRIYPPLWAAYVLGIILTLLVMLSSATYDECAQLPRLTRFSGWNWIGNITASESWLPRLRGDGDPAFLLPNTWTLCYEEQFYAVTGLLLALAARRFFATAYLIALATFALRHLCAAAGMNLTGFFFDGLWIMFCAGILVYERLNYFARLGSRITLGVLLTGVIYGGAERVLATDYELRHFGERILAASAFAILLIYLHRWDTRIVKQSLLRPIAWLGKISYSVFLTHYPIVVLIACLLAMAGVRSDAMVFLVTVPICLTVSLPIAWLFHLAVERHFLNTPVDVNAK